MTQKIMMSIDDWQALVNKPVFTSDGKDVGVVTQIQPDKLVVSYGPITPDKYLIPKLSVKSIERGVVYLDEDGSFVERNYKYE
jgi:sporulation protein YlmC with PRC-barrel domain